MTSKKLDRELGADRSITRRDFIYGSSLLMGGALAGCDSPESGSTVAEQDYSFAVGDDWYGPGGLGEYARSHGNTPNLISAAHEIRTGRFGGASLDATDTGEEFDVVIVGGGFSGLSAGHHFHRLNPTGRALILDNHPIFGGEAKRNDFEVNGVHVSGPQGSNDFAIQSETGDPDDYFTALNLPREYEFAEPGGAAAGMRIPYDNYDHMLWHHDSFDVGHYFGGSSQPWVKDLWKTGLPQSAWSADVQQSFSRLYEMETTAPDGREIGPWLDSMTLKDCYEKVMGMPSKVVEYYDPIMASIIGLGCDGISAHWGRYFDMPGFSKPSEYTAPALLSYPGGNAAIARHFVKKFNPDAIEGDDFRSILFGRTDFGQLDSDGKPVRIRLNSTAVRVEQVGDRVQVTYLRDGEAHRVTAKAVVMASGGWVNRHIVRDLPADYLKAYDEFMHSPVLVANVALTNWRFLERLGVSAAIWSGGFGFTCNIRRPMVVDGQSQPLHPDQPIVMTFYAPIYKPGLPAKQQGIAARAEMLGTSFADYEMQIRTQMSEMFASGGFDAARDIAGIVLNRWGHAYINPGIGFRFGTNGNTAPPDVIRQPFGRIAFGHSELRGHQYWSGAAGEGRRAVESLLDQYF